MHQTAIFVWDGLLSTHASEQQPRGVLHTALCAACQSARPYTNRCSGSDLDDPIPRPCAAASRSRPIAVNHFANLDQPYQLFSACRRKA
jgi:hypothetical protein